MHRPLKKAICHDGKNLRDLFTRILLLFLGWSSLQCSAQTADFSFSPAQGCAPMMVQFTNLSSNAVSYQWNFGNGNTSTIQHPSNVYTGQGTYTVTLTAVTAGGQTSVKTRQVMVAAPPVADFSVNINAACEGYGVFSFQNNSANYDSCLWDFGDGTTSGLQQPQHVYAFAGTFTVKLLVYNKALGCSDFKVRAGYITVHPQPSAVISVDTNRTCNYAHLFSFSGQLLSPASAWVWNFGDGTTASAAQTTHVYNAPGVYCPVLITQNTFGCYDTARLADSIRVLLNPVPTLSVSGDTGCSPFGVSYQVWANDVSSYYWDFGNGQSASTRIGYATYANPGVYQPVFTLVYNNGCMYKDSLPVTVVDQSPSPSFTMTNRNGCAPLPVSFTNTTPPGNFTWYWDFGDGDTSTLMNPVHVYDSVGYFVPSLIATSPNGCTNIARNGWYFVAASGPTANFTADVTTGCFPLTVNFTNKSTGSVSWFWDFGNGTTSTQQHPSATYNAAGNYPVMLVATNAQGCKDTFYLPAPVNVSSSVNNYQPPAPVHACAPHSVYLADASASVAWRWDFGDGTTATVANPYHVYTQPGTYVVSLTTWAPNGGCEHYIPDFQTFIIDAASVGFTYTVSPCPPYEVFFTDTSSNASGWQWSFGDGGTSNQQHPSHIYPGPGVYNVIVDVTSPAGCTSTYQALSGVSITGMGAQATVFTIDSVPPFQVEFYANSSNATSWFWTFGDGSTSTIQNPTHTYTTGGPFTISLTISNDSCTYTYNYPPISFGGSAGPGGTIGNPPVITNPLIYRCAPYTVQFSNIFTLADSVLWVFGDGRTSTEPDPSYSYTDSGTFVPYLYAYQGGVIVDSVVFTDTIHVVKPFTNFNISTTNLCNGVIVDVSTTGSGATYNWNFGNGNTAAQPMASQLYPLVNASYSISLSVTDTNGCSSYIAKSFTTSVSQTISSSRRRACAGDTIRFNAGNLNFAAYAWDFGDGSPADTRKNPTHVYQDSGLFVVTLTATDINGCVVSYNLNNVIEVFDPQASFYLRPTTSNCTWVLAEFVNTSTNSDSWQWTLGNGAVSTVKNPTQYYTQLGYYTVTLVAYKNICSSSYTLPNAVYVPNRSADFSYVQTEACLPFGVQFNDLSVDAAQWRWDFGDGDTSVLQNPVHVYTRVPTGPVTLTITDVNGCSVSKTAPGVNYSDASFAVSSSAGCNPMSVAFNDSSLNVINWQWDFGDGTTSTQQNPAHTYTVDGIYPVTLIVESTYGCFDTLTLDSAVSVLTSRAGISADTMVGCVPLVVGFKDNSLNAVQWQWDFGDNTTSTNQNPAHIYSQPGNYSVQLISVNANNCADTAVFNQQVVVYGAVPSFTVSDTAGCGPLSVSFTDLSQDAVTWEWHFGDGNQDSSAQPVHVYQDTGSFVVTLYVTDSTGCRSSFTSTTAVVVSKAPYATFQTSGSIGCAPTTIGFDQLNSTGDSLVWHFGDNTSFTGNNPQHTYAAPGFYYPYLVASVAEGCRDTFFAPSPIIVDPQPVADFVVSDSLGCTPLTISLTNLSGGGSGFIYAWDFGNGATDSLFAPQYTYTQSGIFTISLIVSSINGCADTMIRVAAVEVMDSLPPAIRPLYRATVESNNAVLVEWQQSVERDISHYEVYRYNTLSATYDPIATVPYSNTGINANVPFFRDQAVNTAAKTYSYKIAAVDLCGSTQDTALLMAHETMLLQATAGHQQVGLAWTPYKGCPISGYDVYRSDLLSTGFVKLVALPPGFVSYTDTGAVCPSVYTYRVVARAVCGNAQYDSWSNAASATPSSDIADQQVDVSRATVVDNQYVLVEWSEPVVLPYLIDRYDVYRSVDQVSYQLVASVPRLVHEYEDLQTAVGAEAYYYKILVQNVCNVSTRYGIPGSSILLQKTDISSGVLLKWSSYFDWDTGVAFYVVEKLNQNGVWEEVERTTGTVTQWEEE